MKILFLMGGSTQISKEEYPLYLSEINEKLILERQIKYFTSLKADDFLFCIKDEELKKYYVKEILEQLVPNPKVIAIKDNTRGAICTALLAMEYIKREEELLIVGIDDFVEDDCLKIVEEFRKQECDAGVISFNSVHPRYSFVKLNKAGEVVEFAEKNPISKNALVSFYYFKKGIDFVNCAFDVIRKDNPVNDVFFISQAMNEMILMQKKIGLYKIDNDKFHSIKTEIQLAQYLSEIKNIKESK